MKNIEHSIRWSGLERRIYLFSFRHQGALPCGGYEVHTPLGTIVATNISSSKKYGVGEYSPEKFSRAIRAGVALGHRLYPACCMPRMSDENVDALYAWTNVQAAIKLPLDYSETGYADDIAQAAGPMGKVVNHGTHLLEIDDLQAIAAYLKTVKPINNSADTRTAFLIPDERGGPTHAFNQIREEMSAALAREDLSPVETVYLRECASCHGVSGQESYWHCCLSPTSSCER